MRFDSAASLMAGLMKAAMGPQPGSDGQGNLVAPAQSLGAWGTSSVEFSGMDRAFWSNRASGARMSFGRES